MLISSLTPVSRIVVFSSSALEIASRVVTEIRRIFYEGFSLGKLCRESVAGSLTYSPDQVHRYLHLGCLEWATSRFGEPTQPIHSFLVGCLSPCIQETSAWVGLPEPPLPCIRICIANVKVQMQGEWSCP